MNWRYVFSAALSAVLLLGSIPASAEVAGKPDALGLTEQRDEALSYAAEQVDLCSSLPRKRG